MKILTEEVLLPSSTSGFPRLPPGWSTSCLQHMLHMEDKALQENLENKVLWNGKGSGLPVHRESEVSSSNPPSSNPKRAP